MLAFLISSLCSATLPVTDISRQPRPAEVRVQEEREKREEYLRDIRPLLEKWRAVGAWPVKWEKPK